MSQGNIKQMKLQQSKSWFFLYKKIPNNRYLWLNNIKYFKINCINMHTVDLQEEYQSKLALLSLNLPLARK